jgi:oligosaccharyltransferase complex subunit epsilon
MVCQQLSRLVAHLHVNRLIMPPKSAPAANAAPSSAVQTLWKAYNDSTSDRLKFIDAFLVFLMLSGIVQFAYCVLVTTFPYNAFLSGCVALNSAFETANLPTGSGAQLASSS